MINRVVKSFEDPEPDEILASSIIKLSEAYEKFKEGPLEERVFLLLLKDQTKLPMKTIQKVLEAIGELKQEYIREVPKEYLKEIEKKINKINDS